SCLSWFMLCAGFERKLARRVLSLTAALLLSACAVGPDYAPPKTDIPPRWTQTAPAASAQPMDDWWKSFNDPLLNQLIAEAIQSNLDVKLAETRIREARANRTGTLAAGLPSFGARSDLTRRRNNINASGQSAAAGAFGVGNQIINIFQAGFDASWELDLFGAVRRAVESADAVLQSEEETRRDTLITLLGEVARNYIELRANQQLLAVTRDNLRSQEDTLALTRIRRQAGLSSELETAQSEGLTAETRAQAPTYEAAAQRAIHALSVLLGQPPGTLAPRLDPPGPLPASAAAGLAELPADVVRRRPDIRRAERKLAAANAEIGVAMAELYPRVKLSAFLGLQNTSLAGFTPIGKSWAMASSVTMPLFNWGRIQANITAKEAQNDGALLSYQAAVLQAYKEVEDALAGLAEAERRIAALNQSVEAQRLAFTLASERWRNGLSAYLDVLLAERGVFQSQRELVQAQSQQAAQHVALYKALGGGWQAGEKPADGGEDWLNEAYHALAPGVAPENPDISGATPGKPAP
ncbi:MAG: efflux transporter outer membrane subunit, partial [Candidatus Methylumidiphilus sp.]